MKNKKPLNCTINTYLSGSLLNKLKDIIISNQAVGNHKYTSVSALLREALAAYKNGMTLIAQDTKKSSENKKKHYSLNLPQELYDFYLTFPKKARTEIFGKVIRTYLQLDSF